MPTFWKANNSGYTDSPFNAGQYTQEQVDSKPYYYNDGHNAVAIPLTDKAMADLGFECTFDPTSINKFLTKSKK